MDMIKVFSSLVGKEELAQVAESIGNQWLGAGPKVKEFEKAFGEKIGNENFLMIDNASNGLFMACKLLDLKPGAEIILPSFTWISCAHAVHMAGYKPVFCDVEYHSQNMNADLIHPHITENTGAIMVVHYAGMPVDMDPIRKLGYPIIEDAAHAVDSYYQKEHCGTIGDIGVFSFDSMKNLAVGEGGGIVFRSSDHFARATRLRLCGYGKSSYEQMGKKNQRWWEQQPTDIFIKMIPSDIAAGVGLAQLRKLSTLQHRRKHIWDYYQESLNGIENLELPLCFRDDISSSHSFFTFCVKTLKRDALALFLKEHSIYSTLRFFPIHLTDLYYRSTFLENTEKFKENALNIPLHPALKDHEVEKIVNVIKRFFETS